MVELKQLLGQSAKDEVENEVHSMIMAESGRMTPSGNGQQ
jgi:hypothetical protein